MALPPESQLREIARLKNHLRKTNDEIGIVFGVSGRTIQRWINSSEFAALAESVRLEQREEIKQRFGSLADDVVTTMVELMQTAKSDFVRVQAAIALGEWIGLDKVSEEKKEDNRDEVVELLKQIAAKPQEIKFLPPPKPGGSLPDWVDGKVEEALLNPENEMVDDGRTLGESSEYELDAYGVRIATN